MSKYISASTAGSRVGTVSDGCGESASQAAGSAVVLDLWTYAVTDGKQGCWRVTGLPIPIGDTVASVQYGFEMFNKNMQAPGTAIPVPSNFSLPGPTMGYT